MALDRTSTQMIKSPFPNGATLKKSLLGSNNLQLADFGYDSSNPVMTYLSAVNNATSFLSERGYGTLEIPAITGVSDYISYLDAIKEDLSVKLRYRYSFYRFPINSESRAITGSFQLGDTVYNTDITTNKALGWVCVEAGIPGKWQAFGFIKDWYTEIEKVTVLPEAGPMQEGRQVYVTSGIPSIYVCKKLSDGSYKWFWMDYSYGTTVQRDASVKTMGMPYFNTDTGYPEWWNGLAWVKMMDLVDEIISINEELSLKTNEEDFVAYKADYPTLTQFPIIVPETDDTARINRGITSVFNSGGGFLLIPTGVYNINALTSVVMKNNVSLILSPNAILQAITNSLDAYAIVLFDGVDNCKLIGGIIKGDRTTHTGITGESGMGIWVKNSTNIDIIDVRVDDCWGDGIYIGGTGTLGKSVHVNVIICKGNNNRRNGLTIAAADEWSVEDSVFKNSNGIAPESGIDIEPNLDKPGVTNGNVSNTHCYGNAGHGIAISQPTTSFINLEGNFCYQNSLSGIQSAYVGEGVELKSNSCYENTIHGISLLGNNSYSPKRLNVSNNKCYRNTKSGIYAYERIKLSTISDNHCKENGEHGIYADLTFESSIVSDNVCEANGQAMHNTYDNIHIVNSSNYNLLKGNKCRKGDLANKPAYGIYMGSNDFNDLKDNDVTLGGETGNIYLPATSTNISVKGNRGYVTEANILSGTLALDSGGFKELTIAHGCGYTPSLKDCSVTLVENTAISDYEINLIIIRSINATNAVVGVYIKTASALAGSTAKLALKVSRN